MKRLHLALFALILTIEGCAYPTSTIEQGASQSTLRLVNAPVGAQVVVDGRVIGERTKAPLDQFSVSIGRHIVEIKVGGSVMLRREYFIGVGSIVEVGFQR